MASTSRNRLIAVATIDALRQLQKAAECLDVDSAQVERVGIHDVAIVTVVFVMPPAEQMLSGSAIVRDHQHRCEIDRVRGNEGAHAGIELAGRTRDVTPRRVGARLR